MSRVSSLSFVQKVDEEPFVSVTLMCNESIVPHRFSLKVTELDAPLFRIIFFMKPVASLFFALKCLCCRLNIIPKFKTHFKYSFKRCYA